jgi:hypothetical protein
MGRRKNEAGISAEKKTVKNLRWTATVWCKDRWP